jgi:endogenous inhibitor of DNA gyrase (YacG/DUF329 family)
MTSSKLSKREAYRLANTLPCDYCKKPFYRCAVHRARFKYNFCSRECNALFHTGEKHKRHDKELNQHRCPICGNKIKRMRKGRIYCSYKCKSIAWSNEGHPRFCQQKISCSNCGKEINKPPAIIRKTNFCSDNCQNSYHSRRISGPNNPRFKYGHFVGFPKKVKGLYHGFTASLKERIRERDNYTCQICGMTQQEHKHKLHVHHIDEDKTHNWESNLVALCRYCHISKAHGAEHKKWQKILLSA